MANEGPAVLGHAHGDFRRLPTRNHGRGDGVSSYAVILPDGTRRETNDPDEFDKLCDLLEEREREYYTEEEQ